MGYGCLCIVYLYRLFLRLYHSRPFSFITLIINAPGRGCKSANTRGTHRDTQMGRPTHEAPTREYTHRHIYTIRIHLHVFHLFIWRMFLLARCTLLRWRKFVFLARDPPIVLFHLDPPTLNARRCGDARGAGCLY